MGPLLGKQEVRRIREIGAAMEEAAATAPLGKRAVYDALLPEIAGLLSATRFWSMRIVPSAAEGWDVEFSSYWGPNAREATRELAVYEQLLRTPRRPFLFDAAIPEPPQRNQVMFVNELPQGRVKLRGLAERTGAGSVMRDQARVLVCDGSRLLGFVGCFRDERFDERDRAAMAALTPALLRAHRLERARRDRAFALAAAESALEIVRDPAFLVDSRGVICHANRIGPASAG